MKKNILFKIEFKWAMILCVISLLPAITHGQNLKINDFVLFGNKVQIGSSSSISGGSIGANILVTSAGNLSNTGNIYSGGTVVLANNNVISGKITAANSTNLPGTILSVGTGVSIGGNIDVNGNIVIGGGTLSGQVTHPNGTTYSGPTPAGGNIVGIPNLPVLPAMPLINIFPNAGSLNISSTQTITPGAYGSIALGNNKTITLSGTGIYVFKSIKNSGNNSFVFDFKNDPTGTIKIYIYGDVDLNKVNASTINGGDATRIYSETHGNGSSSSSGNIAWNINNGSSGNGSLTKWLGTVWAPFAGINIGSGSGSCYYVGALYSKNNVNIQNNVTLYYAPFPLCSTPVANAGSDKILD